MTKKSKHDAMSFFQHLGELRKRIFYSFLIILVFFVGAWPFKEYIYAWLAEPLRTFLPEGQNLAYTSLTEPFMMYIKLSFLAALFAGAPFVFHQLWLFISPALYKKEKSLVVPFVFFSTLFFFIGGAFGYYFVFPFACKFFLEMGQAFTAIITVRQYFDLIIWVLLGISFTFEMPVLTFLLAKLGLVTSGFLIKYFRYALVLIVILAAIITPTPDIATQMMFAIPMTLLYLLSIGIAKVVQPKDE